MGREFELKYRAVPEQLRAIQAAFGPFREISMETAYYDTPEGQLSARRWTFRRRLENGISVCTLKTPHADGGRGEWEVRQEALLDAAPELCKLGAPEALPDLVRGGVVQVCGAKFRRLACMVEAEGCTVELALDQGILLGGSRELPLCEVEVELKAGSDQAAILFAGVLAARYGLVRETASKYKRALELARNSEITEKRHGI